MGGSRGGFYVRRRGHRNADETRADCGEAGSSAAWGSGFVPAGWKRGMGGVSPISGGGAHRSCPAEGAAALPYGKGTSSCDRFDFEEIEGTPEVRQMLRGNPALFCAMLLGQSFQSKGWDLRPGSVREVGGLPVFVYRKTGNRRHFRARRFRLLNRRRRR